MQKKTAFLNAAAFAVVGLLSQGAFAADGTINFEGEIVNATCSVSPKSQNMTVPLGKVRSSVLAAAGSSSTPSKFTIELLDCDPAKAYVTFSGPPDTDATLLRLAGGLVGNTQATNVAVEIGDSSGAKIPLGRESGQYTILQGANSLQFQAKYVSVNGGATAGIANATAEFTVRYE
ncbi:fimbrial protein [Variovorax soli]|uniref:fimbrial protein n=1 Tax=Variovorax soli TaxID=376815 RepID=UPI000838CAC1|nr:fimbrial protein [Variovorax soli]